MMLRSALVMLSWVFLSFSLMATLSFAADDNVVRLQGISIQGKSEEPNVVYITPWRPPPGTGRLYQPIYSYRDHWFQPLDRQSLGRELRYGERYLPKQVNVERLQQLNANNEAKVTKQK
ncbi:hypothetical protein [Bacterioplanoides sp. SCSIO 12839]|uniref:hypothetical protein n=1 Tax=Bacterioplanoides sp. SCSIO 12839 TaxID=2829569 RepID=UPI0021058A12|nr:hypothetical protein [Bacterioplanoides sp. SCSIO 12839]UTW49755.1 hypothetical protein KFF03_07690 [Bacterioplanoides sp. SCSIO 12839]